MTHKDAFLTLSKNWKFYKIVKKYTFPFFQPLKLHQATHQNITWSLSLTVVSYQYGLKTWYKSFFFSRNLAGICDSGICLGRLYQYRNTHGGYKMVLCLSYLCRHFLLHTEIGLWFDENKLDFEAGASLHLHERPVCLSYGFVVACYNHITGMRRGPMWDWYDIFIL